MTKDTCLTMSRPKIVNFNFGQAQNSKPKEAKRARNKGDESLDEEKKIEPDELILIDAFWVKEGVPIRFIPQQQDPVNLIVVFAFRYDDLEHDKTQASFNLNLEIPGTFYSQESPFTIEGSKLSRKLKARNGGYVLGQNGNNCYYCEITNFSSDLSKCSSECIKY